MAYTRKTRKQKASKLITRDKLYAMKPNSKYITIDDLKTGKRKYVKNTKTNRDKIISLRGQYTDFYGGRYLWF